MTKKTGSFKYVYIPADTTEPLKELSQDVFEGKEVECLLNCLKDHFRSQKRQKTAEQVARQREQFLASVPPEQRDKIDENMLKTAADLGLVENIALLSNSRDNGFIGVNMYCDDEAAFVDAPFNVRASDIARCCGKELEVRGDAFLARVFDNEDEFQRMDLTLKEVTSTAAWVKEAYEQNERKRKGDSAESVLRRMQQDRQQPASVAQVKELTPAEAEKESGNDAFKRGNFEEAIQHYTKAIDLDRTMPAAFSNRALARLKLGQATEAEGDCNHALLLQPNNVKALLRRAAAREELNRYREALEDYQSVLKLEPANKEAKQKLVQLEPQLRQDDLADAGTVSVDHRNPSS